MEDKLFTLLGLGVPFYLAAATYAVFSWLDSNASDEATKVISSWLHGRSHNKPDLGNLIINAFNRIYTSALLSFRAFHRSAAISSIIWLLIYLIPWLVNIAKHWNDLLKAPIPFYPFVITEHVWFLFIVILSDYVSLPFVRRFLRLAQIYPIRASVLSSIVGLVVVATSFFIFSLVSFIIAHQLDPHFYSREILYAIRPDGHDTFPPSNPIWWLFAFMTRMRPALIIHLWLPLFALSSLTVRLVFMMFRAVEWAQWFLKQGDAHPLKAIGIVATIVVFGSAMLVKEAWAAL